MHDELKILENIVADISAFQNEELPKMGITEQEEVLALASKLVRYGCPCRLVLMALDDSTKKLDVQVLVKTRRFRGEYKREWRSLRPMPENVRSYYFGEDLGNKKCQQS